MRPSKGCVRLPGAGAGGAEYLYFAGLTDGQLHRRTGRRSGYKLAGGATAVAARAAAGRRRGRLVSVRQGGVGAGRFTRVLRDMEREAVAASRGPRAAAASASGPGRGAAGSSVRSGRSTCSRAAPRPATSRRDYVQVTGTGSTSARTGRGLPRRRGARADLLAGRSASVGALFDNHLYPSTRPRSAANRTSTATAWCSILLTDRVNQAGVQLQLHRQRHSRLLLAVRSDARPRQVQRRRDLLRSRPGCQLQHRRAGRERLPAARS